MASLSDRLVSDSISGDQKAPLNARRYEIRKVGVLGAGTMGARIAAHVANAGIPVLLLDLAADGANRNAVAVQALEGLKKAKPAAFSAPTTAVLIEPGN